MLCYGVTKPFSDNWTKFRLVVTSLRFAFVMHQDRAYLFSNYLYPCNNDTLYQALLVGQNGVEHGLQCVVDRSGANAIGRARYKHVLGQALVLHHEHFVENITII